MDVNTGVELFQPDEARAEEAGNPLGRAMRFLDFARYTYHPDAGAFGADNHDMMLTLATIPDAISSVGGVPLILAGDYDDLSAINPFIEATDPKHITLEKWVSGFIERTDTIDRSKNGRVNYIRIVQHARTETDEGEPTSKEFAYTVGRSVAVYDDAPHEQVEHPDGKPICTIVFMGTHLQQTDETTFNVEGQMEVRRNTIKAVTIYDRSSQ